MSLEYSFWGIKISKSSHQVTHPADQILAKDLVLIAMAIASAFLHSQGRSQRCFKQSNDWIID